MATDRYDVLNGGGPFTPYVWDGKQWSPQDDQANAPKESTEGPPQQGAHTLSNRKALHAYVSDDTHEKWHAIAEGQGVSVSAIMEVLGANADVFEHFLTHNVLEDGVSMVRAARKIDATRRRR